MPSRNASAPRLIEWTGERCVPWAPDVQVIYEHLHRYMWVRAMVAGKAVLDLGSGEGFGSAILSEAAASVHGIDIDETTVAHARLRYGTDAVTFAVGDATKIPAELDGRFDVVVAFEVIEHVVDHEALLAGVRRALKPGGTLIISTPNRLLYETIEGGNPFHLHELSDVEFGELIGASFEHHAMLVQRVGEGSRIELRGSDGPELEPYRVEPAGDEWAEVGPPSPYYLLAVASDDALPDGVGSSTLLDHSLGMLGQARRDHGAALASSQGHAAGLQEQVRAEQAARLDAQGREDAFRQEATITQLGLGDQLSQLRAQRDDALALASREAIALTEAHARVGEAERERQEAWDELHRQVSSVNESISWRLFTKAKRRWRGSGEQPRAIARATGWGLRTASKVNGKRVAHATRDERAAAEARALEQREARAAELAEAARLPILTVPGSEHPDVSIVIPVYSGAEITEACLRSIVAATIDGPAYEVIVVDDCADEATKAMLARVDGIRVIENPENLGFLKTTNRGVAHARGAVTVLLNNDTEPQPGWLPALLGRLALPGVGAVGGKLVYPTGKLQEAGGVIFADGSAANYGNGADPFAAANRFARPVDYCSAALLAIRTELWNELGGFDEVYGPGYYEDVDLCFRVRQAGHEVWYEPQALILHKEGGSHGTDVNTGVKRYQVLNQAHFIERWRDELADRPATFSLAATRVHADRRRGPIVLIADHIVPEPDRDAGSLRMMHLINAFDELGARVVFLPNNRHATPGYAQALEARGVEVLDGDVPLHSRLLELRSECKLVILSRPNVAAPLLPEIRAALPGAKILYDTVDLHWVRETGRQTFEPGGLATIQAYREIELALVRSADMTAVVTDEEQQEILAAVPDADVRYLPVVHHLPDVGPGRDGRRGLLFVGGFRHRPNVDAARQLGEHIMPEVRSRGLDIPLTIVGPDVPSEIEALGGLDIEVAGWVEHLEPLLDGSVAMVAPLRYGAGMKGKVGQALAHGLPVITTEVGAQGFGLVDGENVLLAETPQEFADAIGRLQADPELWAKLSEGGRAVIDRTCSTAIMGKAAAALLEDRPLDPPSPEEALEDAKQATEEPSPNGAARVTG